MKNGRFKVLLLVLAMVFSTFASGMTQSGPIPGNDGGGYDSDETFYFDENGNEVDGPTDYWVSFEVDGQYLSFTSNNVIVTSVTVKGGNAHYIYTDLGSSENGMYAPLVGNVEQNGGNIPDISHYNFTFEIADLPPPPPDPEGEIDITKIVVDHEDEVITENNTEFKFRLYMWVDDDWEEVDDESPFYITGNDTVTIDGLTLGKYKFVEEDIPDGFELDSANDVEVTLDEEHLERKAEFTNKMDDDTPPPPGKGKLIVHKRIQRISGSIDANIGDDEFTIQLSGPLPVDSNLYEERTLTINDDENGDHVTFDDLPFGDYILEETHINGEPIGSNEYHIQMPGNNGEEVGSSVEIESNGTENRWLVNHETPPPPPWEGTISIQKLIREEPNESLEGFEFELWKDGERVRGPESTDIYGEIDFSGLPAGEYEIRELESDFIADYLDDNPIEIGPEIENENDDVWVVRVNNIRIEIEDIVVQKDVSNDDDLSGFVFRLYRIVEVDEGEFDEEFVAERTTGITGRIVFEDQPDGEYVLYEVPRTGYVMGIGAHGSEEGEEFFHSENMTYPIEVTNRKLPTPELGEIEVEKTVLNSAGNPMSSNTPFYFELQVLGEGWMTIDSGLIVGNGTYVFDELEDGEYRVREVDIDSDFYLVGSNNIEVEIEDGSIEDVEFINRLKPLPPDDDDDDDDDDRPRPRPEPEEDEDEEEVLEITVIEQVPEAVPVPEPVIEVVEEVVPLATLPKTGAHDPSFFGGIGAALLGLGLLLKKKEDK